YQTQIVKPPHLSWLSNHHKLNLLGLPKASRSTEICCSLAPKASSLNAMEFSAGLTI
ncbi:hypothetical protein SOVF_212000 isoform A, partial [Spinacia oleracea]